MPISPGLKQSSCTYSKTSICTITFSSFVNERHPLANESIGQTSTSQRHKLTRTLLLLSFIPDKSSQKSSLLSEKHLKERWSHQRLNEGNSKLDKCAFTRGSCWRSKSAMLFLIDFQFRGQSCNDKSATNLCTPAATSWKNTRSSDGLWEDGRKRMPPCVALTIKLL